MRHMVPFASVCAVFAVAEVRADLNVGDSVALVVRPNDIPGHPSDGDPHVSIRFKSGSNATVQEIGNWVKVQGQSTTGGTGNGWILKRYVVSEGTGGPVITLPTLDWCPAKGSPDKHPSGRIRIATWNIEALQAEDGERLFESPQPSPARQPEDYERIRCYTRLIDADIVAVQEMDGMDALERIFDTDVYTLHMSARNQRQDTGFAFKKGLEVTIRPDFEALDVGDVRYGARIDLKHNGKTIRLMSVHLKSGCFSNADSESSEACMKLQAQLPIVEGWIDESAEIEDGFVILGDFNRRLALDGDLFWAELDDGNPPNADLITANKNMPSSCRDNKYPEFIDHIVFDKRAADWLDPSSFRHVTFRQQDTGVWDLISDHCPVVAELWID